MVLAPLAEQPGPTMPMGELTVTISAPLSLPSNVASRLEARGYLTQQRRPAPGQAANATRTGAGYATVAAAAPGYRQAVRYFLIDTLTRGHRISYGATTKINRKDFGLSSTPSWMAGWWSARRSRS